MIIKSDINIISNYISVLRTKLLKIFSIEDIEVKFFNVRKENLRINLNSILKIFKEELSKLPLSEYLTTEIENLVNSLNEEIITKNRNKPLNKYTKDAITYNFNILTHELNEIKSSLANDLLLKQNQQKVKFDDVKVSNIELSLFILLAAKHGLISYNDVSEIDKSKSFSILTNFSENTLRQNISGEYKSSPHLLPLKQINLDNLKKILNNILNHIDSITV